VEVFGEEKWVKSSKKGSKQGVWGMMSNQVVGIPRLALLKNNYYILYTFGGDWGIQKPLNFGKKKKEEYFGEICASCMNEERCKMK
jgi:hypothetical protein